MLICDGHAHLYPRYDLALALDCLVANLRRLAPPGDRPPLLLACLAERAGMSVFSGADFPMRAGQYEIHPGPEPACLTVKCAGDEALFLVLGRQYAAAERLEVLGLALPAAEELDGLPAREIIRRVRAAGGLPVLPWAPGKWFFKRGRLVAELIGESRPGELWLGDTALRPTIWPLPALLRRAQSRGLPWLPGSDPLPLAGEERRLGVYGCVGRDGFDPGRPVTALRELLRQPPGAFQPAGRRAGVFDAARRILLNYFRLAFA